MADGEGLNSSLSEGSALTADGSGSLCWSNCGAVVVGVTREGGSGYGAHWYVLRPPRVRSSRMAGESTTQMKIRNGASFVQMCYQYLNKVWYMACTSWFQEAKNEDSMALDKLHSY